MIFDDCTIKRGLFVLLLFAVGCDVAIPTVAPTPVPACTPTTNNPDTYRGNSASTAKLIYQFSQTAIPGTEAAIKLAAQHEAFVLLQRQVRKWSDFEDVLVNDNLMVRITVTYISPVMIESVVLNQIFYRNMPVADFEAEVRNGLNSVARREELPVLVTLTATEYNEKLTPNDELNVQLPIAEMVLLNTNNTSVTPSHEDNQLRYPINLRPGPEHGYVAYPIALSTNGVCNWMLDPAWNTTMTLHMPYLTINQKQYNSLTWSIDYRPLVQLGGPDEVPAFAQPRAGFESIYSPSMDAPLPVNGVPRSDTIYWDTYWEQMSRFVWLHLASAAHK
jgi:hypothetical protein